MFGTIHEIHGNWYTTNNKEVTVFLFDSDGYELMGTTYDVTCIPDDIVCNTTSYRSFDGTCNNLLIPIYGAANTAESRFLDPEYADGI